MSINETTNQNISNFRFRKLFCPVRQNKFQDHPEHQGALKWQDEYLTNTDNNTVLHIWKYFLYYCNYGNAQSLEYSPAVHSIYLYLTAL